MTITEEHLKDNPNLNRLVQNALRKEAAHPQRHIKMTVPPVGSGKTNKYHVSDKDARTDTDGVVFASKGEMQRWHILQLLEKAGKIKDLRRQVVFILQEAFISKQPEWGEQAAILYVADFVYTDISYRPGYANRACVEDHKGSKDFVTSEYKVKRRLFLYTHASYAFFEVYPE